MIIKKTLKNLYCSAVVFIIGVVISIALATLGALVLWLISTIEKEPFALFDGVHWIFDYIGYLIVGALSSLPVVGIVIAFLGAFD